MCSVYLFFISVAQEHLETVIVRRHEQDNKVNRQWVRNYFGDLHRKYYGRGALIKVRRPERKRYIRTFLTDLDRVNNKHRYSIISGRCDGLRGGR
jgi:hypothetical protein